MKRHLTATFTAALLIACSGQTHPTTVSAHQPATAPSEMLSMDDIRWQQLNPARGDKSPKAATLWGNRQGEVATGFLVQFIDGFSSPPHIHNVSYRGVVISGLVHNDDPQAAEMWMPAGSFWTQPKGEVHITSARGAATTAYIEIDSGPYLVEPPANAFDSGERPVNVHESNIVWQSPSGMATGENAPRQAYLWGNRAANQLNGSLVELPAGFTGRISSRGTLRVVVIRGRLELAPGTSDVSPLAPGSYFGSLHPATHGLSATTDTILYVRARGSFDVSW